MQNITKFLDPKRFNSIGEWPRSGLILGSTTAGNAASAGGPRTSGVAALMAGAARGRVPDACGAIVTAGSAGSTVGLAAAALAPHNTNGAPGTRHRSHRRRSAPKPPACYLARRTPDTDRPRSPLLSIAMPRLRSQTS
ncbi:unnamed protein product [Arctia plantaginis]|uniref:Uncharacterized protein n=1 Tax=Arctia plantaginis TaxID=874455 RepID=A0A8S1A1J0_ARCPL|nr:unnamed protein product [Arctia plantaginis]